MTRQSLFVLLCITILGWHGHLKPIRLCPAEQSIPKIDRYFKQKVLAQALYAWESNSIWNQLPAQEYHALIVNLERKYKKYTKKLTPETKNLYQKARAGLYLRLADKLEIFGKMLGGPDGTKALAQAANLRNIWLYHTYKPHAPSPTPSSIPSPAIACQPILMGTISGLN